MNCTAPGTFHIGGNVYIRYNQAAFGDSIFSKGNVSYTRGPMLPTAQYIVDVRDFNLNDTTLSFSWFAMASLSGMPPSPLFYTAVPASGSAMLAQFTFQIQDPTAPIWVAYDSVRMNSLFTYMAPGPQPTSYVTPYAYQPPIFMSVLPVSLEQFAGVREEEGDVRLTWQTTQEENSHYFQVEESLDGWHFYPKGQVQAAGYAQTARNYNFLDREASQGRVYYRLRQVDLDGNFTFSHVVEVQPVIKTNQWLTVYPIPAKDFVRFESVLSEATLESIEIFDANGKIMWTEKPSDSMLQIDLSNWPQGIYHFRAQSREGDPYMGRFTKR